MGIWYNTLVNIYKLNSKIMNLGSSGVSIWCKDIYQLDLGGRDTLNEYSVKETYNSLSSDGQTLYSHSWPKV